MGTNTNAATTLPVKPRLRVVRIDETRNWNEAITSVVGRIWGVYVYDAERHVYCCELTPSRELRFVGSTWEKSPEDDEENERIAAVIAENDAWSDDVIYVHRYQADKLAAVYEETPTDEEWAAALDSHDGNIDEAAEEVLGATWEYVRCNGYVG